MQYDVESKAAPMNSQKKVINRTFLNKVFTSAKFLTLIWLEANFKFFKLSLLFKIIKKTDENVIKPSPPVCIKIKITIFPNKDHCEKVSFTENPVMHVAEVEVNMQSVIETFLFGFEDIGNINSIEPNKIIKIKLKQTVLTGFFLKKFCFFKKYIIIARKAP